jgi:succinate dehydrogenase / fumarate reductase membrane anchor subunit
MGMVTNVTSLTGNGLKDWLIQRVSAVVLGFYLLIMLSYCLMHPHMTYEQWSNLFHCKSFMVLNVVTMLSLVLHAWIGLWTVTTDYLKPTCIRLPIQMLIAALLLGLFIWFLMILWG